MLHTHGRWGLKAVTTVGYMGGGKGGCMVARPPPSGTMDRLEEEVEGEGEGEEWSRALSIPGDPIAGSACVGWSPGGRGYHGGGCRGGFLATGRVHQP